MNNLEVKRYALLFYVYLGVWLCLNDVQAIFDRLWKSAYCAEHFQSLAEKKVRPCAVTQSK